ncbi:protein TonB [Variovorax sp. 770b2]|nr:protein TonB [Variovorax sp. 770b2]
MTAVGALPERRLRLVFAVGLGISVLLHAGLVLPWLMNDWAPARPPRHEQLRVDLLGMVSNRQSEQQLAGRPTASAVAEPPREQRVAPAPPASALPKSATRKEARERPTAMRQAAPSPVQVEVPAEAPAQRTPDLPAPLAAAPPAANGAEEERVQQTVRPRNADADALRKYLASLKRAIQNRLVYPAEAREAGYVGAPTIRFVLTENGDILSGSLAVQKSSGYPVLDESAMRAALAGAPFEKPPRQMDVAIAVAFVQDRERP